MTPRHLRWLGVSLAALASLLGSCAGAPTRIYTLYAVAPGGPSVYAGPPVRVDVVNFPAALDRIEVVRNGAPGELELSDTAHWSAPLGDVARQTLAADLIARLPAGKALFPDLPKPAGALGVSVDLRIKRLVVAKLLAAFRKHVPSGGRGHEDAGRAGVMCSRWKSLAQSGSGERC